MEPHACGSRLDRPDSLSQQGCNDTGEDIAAAALGKAAAAGGIHQDVALRPGGNGPVAFQHQHAAVGHGKVPGRFHPVPVAQIAADAAKLHVVGRQNCDPAPAGIQNIYMPGEGVYAVGVQHHRLFCFQQLPHQPGRTLAAAQAGAQGQHVAAGQLFQDLGQGLRGEHPAFFRQRKGHGGSTLSRFHGPDGLRHPQGHQPAAGAHRRRRGEVRGPGIAHGAAHDQQLPEGALVAVDLPGRQGPAHKVRLHRLHRADQTFCQVRRDADVPDGDVPAVNRTVSHCLTDLWECKGHGPVCPNGPAQNPAGVRLHAAGNVGGYDFGAAGVHGINGGGKHAACRHLPAEAHAEHGIHHRITAADIPQLFLILRGKWLQLHAAVRQAAGHLQTVRRQLFVCSNQKAPHLHALEKQKPGGGNAVSAVVPRAAQRRDPAAGRLFRQQLHRRSRHALRRPLHQVDGGNFSLLNGDAVQLPHLGGCGQFHSQPSLGFFSLYPRLRPSATKKQR